MTMNIGGNEMSQHFSFDKQLAPEGVSFDEIKRRMSHHKPSEETQMEMSFIRAAFIDLTDLVMSRIPVSREQALVMTKLEEALFWTMAALARPHA